MFYLILCSVVLKLIASFTTKYELESVAYSIGELNIFFTCGILLV